jgi:hypothetical protein
MPAVLSTAWFLARFRPEQFRPSEALLVYEVALTLQSQTRSAVGQAKGQIANAHVASSYIGTAVR